MAIITIQHFDGSTYQTTTGGKTIQMLDGVTFQEPAATGAALLQGITAGSIRLIGLSPRDSASARTRLLQGVTRGEIRYVGSSPNNVYGEYVVNLVQGITAGRINLTGVVPQDAASARARLVEGITRGRLDLIGLTPNDTYHIPTNLIQESLSGQLLLIGLSPTELLTGKQQYKSAASKLGLGKYDSVDIWSTPFSTYIASFDRKQQYAEKRKDQLEEMVRQYLAELDLLELQLQEMQSYSAGQLTSILKTEKRQAQAREKEIQRELRKIKSRILQQEDEELLILLLS